jgi:CspA family cold shock protein
MITGRVKWFNRERGYGFLESPHHPHILVQCPSIENGYDVVDLKENETVVFDVRDSRGGPYAVQVRRWEQ